MGTCARTSLSPRLCGPFVCPDPWTFFPGEFSLHKDCRLFSLNAKMKTKLLNANPGSALELSMKRKIYLLRFEARLCLEAKVQIP